MAKAKKLVMGADSPVCTSQEVEERIAVLCATVRKYLPEFASAVAAGAAPATEAGHADLLTIHQDAFAAGYHDDEYTLLGMALKYAGLHGVKVMMLGTNGETC